MYLPPENQCPRSWFRKTCAILLCLGLLCQTGLVSATSVAPPNFDELVAEADVVFDGVVTAVTASLVGVGEARHIESAVTFTVLDALKGQAATPFVLKTAGGAIGNLRMEITGAPKFAVGERMILFVEKNGAQFIPLVGVMHGQFRIKRDSATSREIVLTHDDQTLFDSREIGRETDEPRAMSAPLAPMTPDSFKAEIRSKLQTLPGH